MKMKKLEYFTQSYPLYFLKYFVLCEIVTVLIIRIFSSEIQAETNISQNAAQINLKQDIEIEKNELNPVIKDSINLKTAYFNQQLEKLSEQLKERKDPNLISFWTNDLFLKASSAANEGNNKVALVIFQALVRLLPKDLYLKKRVAYEFIKLGQFEQALPLLENIINEQKYGEEKNILLLAGVYAALEKYKKAQLLYKKILQKSPDHQEACLFLARSYLSEFQSFLNEKQIPELSKLKNENKLIKNKKVSKITESSTKNKITTIYKEIDTLLGNCLAKSTSSNSSSIISYQRGKYALEANNLKLAKKYFSKSLEYNSNYYFAILGLGGLLEIQKEWNEAISLYKQYLNKFPTQLTILNKLIQVLFAQSRYNEIAPYLKTLVELDPDDLNTKIKLGIIYIETNDIEKAKVIFHSLLEAVPNSDKIFYYLGIIYAELKDFTKSELYFSKISTDGSLYHDGQIQMANILLTQAISATEKEVQKRDQLKLFSFINDSIKLEKKGSETNNRAPSSLSPTMNSTLQNNNIKSSDDRSLYTPLNIIKASFYEHQKDYKTAIEIVQSLKKRPDYHLDHDYYLAGLYEKSKNYEEAYKIIHQIISSDPHNAHAYNFLGYSLLDRGIQLNRSFQYIKKALQLSPHDGHIRDSLGWYYYKTGKYQMALKELLKSFEINNSDGTITKHLAMTYHALKNYALAEKYYSLAYELYNSIEEKDAIKKILGIMQKEAVANGDIHKKRPSPFSPVSKSFKKNKQKKIVSS